MLDIEYIKQIDEVLDMPDFKLDTNFYGNTLVIYNGSLNIRFEAGNGENIGAYYFYLVRVIEAINKAYMYDDVVDYYIVQDLESVDVYRNTTMKESYFSTDERFNCYNDKDKEKAITYVMDHIKEKV